MREQGSTRALLIKLLPLASARGEKRYHHLFNLSSKTLCISTDYEESVGTQDFKSGREAYVMKLSLLEITK